MKKKSSFLKKLLKGVLAIFLVFCALMITPRIMGLINPEKAPIGYHYTSLDYLAIGVGLESLINKTPDVPSDVEEFKNIEYKNINGKSLQLDIYKPKNVAKPAPLLVFIHGGGWKGGQRQDYLVYLIAFAKKGYMTATVSYRLGKEGGYPACVQDISDAVQWFYNNSETYGYDPDRIALIGGSAGGHLSLMAGYGWKDTKAPVDSLVLKNTHRIKAVVDIYGPVDFTTPYARNHPLITNFVGSTYDKNPGIFVEASPNSLVNKNNPPTMILQGSSDDLVPASQSDNLKMRLDSLGVPNVYYRLPLWPHTMDIVQRVNNFCQVKMDAFFKQYL